jgi:hypothetical protein
MQKINMVQILIKIWPYACQSARPILLVDGMIDRFDIATEIDHRNINKTDNTLILHNS